MTTDEWLSIAAAAERLGITTQAVRARVKRGTVESRKNNRGKLTVHLVGNGSQNDADALPTLPKATVTPTVAKILPAVSDSPDSRIEIELRRHLADQQAQITHERAQTTRQFEQLRADFEAERLRHDAEIERMVGQIHAERTFWVERADAAEVRAEQANNMLADLVGRIMTLPVPGAAPTADAGRPWWKWWLS